MTASLFALVVADAASADEVIDAGAISARVGAVPFTLGFEQADGGSTLVQSERSDQALPGVLGFHTASGWSHATAVLGRFEPIPAGGIQAELATDDPLGRTVELRIAPAGEGTIELRAQVVGAPGADRIGLAFSAPSDEAYFGFGERSNAVDQRGNEVENYVSDGPFPAEDRDFVRVTTPPWGIRDRDDATYFPIPWMLSSRGYGVLIDNDETSRFDLARSDGAQWSLDVDGDSLGMRVFAGPRPAAALGRFTAAVGRQPAAAAPWTYGPWFQTGQPNVVPLEDEAQIIETLRTADAPVSAAETQMHFLPCGAQRGRADYIAARTKQFHAAGLAHLGYFNPHVCNTYSPVYDEAAAAGLLQRDSATGQPFTYPSFVGGDGPAGFTQQPLALFDFTNPATTPFYEGLLREAYDAGYDGWMEDFGEYSPPTAVSADGTSPERMHNLYPATYHCAVAGIADDLGDRPLSRHQRSGWTGSAKCADIVWGGDPTTRFGFDGLSSTITQGMGVGMSGVSRWGSDIGGYNSFGANSPRPGVEEEKLTPELLRRWIEVGAASPVMRTKRSGIAIPSYTRPQVFDPGILPTWRKYTKLHTQLYPYLRAADAVYRTTGMPIMRQGVLTHPADPKAVAAEGQYMFGPDLLVAPVLAAGQRSQRVYAPRGRWLDFWRSMRFAAVPDGDFVPRRPVLRRGGRELELKANLGRLPMLIRAGSLLPLLPADVDTLAGYGEGADLVKLSDRRRRLAVDAFPRGRSTARFYEKGRLISRERRGRWRLRAEGRSPVRHFEVRAALGSLRDPFVPGTVALDGRPLPKGRWSYDSRSTVLRVRANLSKRTLTVRR